MVGCGGWAETPPPLAAVERPLPHPSRQAIPALHRHLRQCIVDGRLPPGAALSQVALARQLGVSRTPLREVLRMLQEEGFLRAEPNHRMRVRALDPEELDADYASRILLETLALSASTPALPRARHAEADRALRAMRRAGGVGDTDGWFDAHDDFHRALTAGASTALRRQLRSLADRSTRYIRLYQAVDLESWRTGRDHEHATILEEVRTGQAQAATATLARHLARTALRVLSRTAPGYSPTAIPRALSLLRVPCAADLAPGSS